ncbi:DUF6691 family protein [Pseudomonas citronellolis]|uniref:DUF6691 family protein n=1 Tax=Pseudomonas citronellolis TaxID=53408 RepID=UPI0023E47488|nr:DUF6691 family protein [Pseudomonas citronellolis]MDF3932381.1 YeeE/YedE family protein [Pseudomonas citronellolis]
MARLSAFFCGLLFGVGLLLAGMADPAKVLAFLDLGGAWDPSLALVMFGAIGAALPFFTLAKRRSRNLLGGAMQLPPRRGPDRRLLLGSLVFGAGWGLAGVCPGPALVGLGAGYWQSGLFVVAMLAGMGVYEWLQRRPGRAA